MINPASIFFKLIISAPCSHGALLHDHGDLHVLVDRAIQVVGARSTPGANLMDSISGELQTVDLLGARFLFGFGSAIHPLAQANEVDVRRVIDQLETIPFLDGDAALEERLNAHVDVDDMTTTATRVVGSCTLTACDDKHRQYTDYDNKCKHFFHRLLLHV
jgi:hypothetical protein